jgi:hypothetical protein
MRIALFCDAIDKVMIIYIIMLSCSLFIKMSASDQRERDAIGFQDDMSLKWTWDGRW